jgi:myo-inositol-1(or 4)-monophosphatase
LFDVTGRSFAALLPKVADVRRTGSACMDLCDVAAGRSDGHFEWRLQPWDYCAATLMVEEAGGKCGNILGGPVTYDKGIPHIAASARIFDKLQETLQQIWNESGK